MPQRGYLTRMFGWGGGSAAHIRLGQRQRAEDVGRRPSVSASVRIKWAEASYIATHDAKRAPV